MLLVLSAIRPYLQYDYYTTAGFFVIDCAKKGQYNYMAAESANY